MICVYYLLVQLSHNAMVKLSHNAMVTQVGLAASCVVLRAWLYQLRGTIHHSGGAKAWVCATRRQTFHTDIQGTVESSVKHCHGCLQRPHHLGTPRTPSRPALDSATQLRAIFCQLNLALQCTQWSTRSTCTNCLL